jgi:predicted NACHT family NTPase
LGYNLEQFLGQFWRLSNTDIELVFNQGKALVLLDGLDEVTGEAGKQITREIKRFARVYPQVLVVVTCRTQSQESRFDRFDYVEVADFNEEQVRAFAEHWFGTVCGDVGENKAREFLEQLFREENKPIRELAITPILLSLTCAVFQQTGKFYSQRSKLYEEGLELLLVQWDKSREVERDEVYRDSSVERKLELLSYVAVKKFEQEQYVLFEQEELEGYIGEFLGIDRRESQGVLRAIASQHGLLIERSHKVWSFSHLTFQEYLVAKWFCEQKSWDSFVIHVWKPYWQEAFILTLEIIDSKDILLSKMLEKTNNIISTDTYLQSFLTLTSEKSYSVKSAFRASTVRRYYFSLYIFYLSGRLKNSFSVSAEQHQLTMLMFNSANAFKNEADDVLATDTAIDYDLMLTLSQSTRSGKAFLLVRALESSIPIASELNPILYNLLKKLRNLLPEFELEMWQEELNREVFQEWWTAKGEKWTQELIDIMNEHRNIGHGWKINELQMKILLQYYNANNLLLNCLNSLDLVIDSLRQEIEDNFLLPIAEIEKRKRENIE